MLCVRVRFSSVGDSPHCYVSVKLFADGRSGCAGEFSGNFTAEAGANPFSKWSGCTPLRRGERQHLIGNRTVQDLLEPRKVHTDKSGVGDPMVPTDHDIDGAIIRQPVIAEYEGLRSQ